MVIPFVSLFLTFFSLWAIIGGKRKIGMSGVGKDMIPDIKEKLVKEYPYLTELHAHSLPVSSCSEFRAKELVEAYRKTGVSSMVLTNHFTPKHFEGKSKAAFVGEYIEAYQEFRHYAEEAGICAIFGMELRFSENNNDYLLYGIDEGDAYRIADYVELGLARFRAEFVREGYLLIQAHPKRNGMIDMPLDLLDGYEAFNMHPGHNSRVGVASRIAHGAGLIVTGGTDFHHPAHEGICLLRTREKLASSRDVAIVLRSGDYVLDIGGSIIFP